MSRDREILDLIADAVLITDDETACVVEANAAAAQILRYDREELIGMSLRELSAEPEASLKAFEERVAFIPLRHYRRKDGSTIALEITTKYATWGGRAVHVATYREISARVEAEHALRESEERFRAVAENLGVGVCIVDPAELIRFANQTAEKTFGVRDGLLGKNLGEFTDEAEFARIREETARRKRGEKSTYIIVIRRPDGERRQLSVIATPQFDNHRNFTGTIGIFQDITEQTRLQQSLQRERNLLLTLINTFPDHIYLRDRENRFVLANKAVAEWMGAGDPAFLEGKRDSDFYPSQIAAQFAADDRLILEEGKSIINQERLDTSVSGIRRWVMTTKVPLFDESGQVIGLVGIGRDYTESRETKEALRRSQEQLQQGQKMEAIGRLAGGIAHDFNNLLTVIAGFAELIDARLPDGDPSKTEVGEIRRASERAANLTAQLLAFGRKQMLQLRVVNLNDVVNAMRTMLPRVLGEDVDLSLRLSGDSASIRADKGQLEQVIMNLSVNARDAMPRGGRLTIATENRTISLETERDRPEIKPGDYVALTVSDTGLGMDASTLSRIFEPFFTTKELGKGTGLGLATVYGIVKQSDGYIYCDSFPGKGTSFLIYFPRVPGTGGDDRAERAQTTNGTGDETVLLVEDEDALRGFVRTILQRHGYTVIDAQDGVAALELLSHGDRAFDILVTDVVMPRMGGHELAQRVLEAHPAMRVLYMSGYTEEHIVRPAVTDRRIDLIRKPFDTAGFLAHLREVLDRP